jgi:hypothetical protein
MQYGLGPELRYSTNYMQGISWDANQRGTDDHSDYKNMFDC